MYALKSIALLGNFAPRQCGIATFTTDVARALSGTEKDRKVDVIAVSDRAGYEYEAPVVYELAEQDLPAYAKAAEFINAGGYDVLCVQHEYGIYGGLDGVYLLDMLRKVKIPIVTTLHTVLRDPTPSQRAVMGELLSLSERIVVMSDRATDFLCEVHNINPDKVDLIPHGIPNFTPTTGKAFRETLNIEGPMILTFGLLSPDKGIQYAIQAMPKIVEKYPKATYVVLGATHPNIRALSGEEYRNRLIDLAAKLGVTDNVRFVDRFVTSEELVDYLGATDMYITPYLKPNQITSGTLAYAVGAGKAVISTSYWYAEELLAEGRGVLVPFKNSDAITDAVLRIQGDKSAMNSMEAKARAYGEQMKWPQVGARYVESFQDARAERALGLKMHSVEIRPSLLPSWDLPELKFDHLYALSDDTGILQHATHSIPNRKEGYCVDDNARALLLTAFLETEGPLSPQLALLQSRYLSFVMDAFNPEQGKFRNFMSYDRNWLESVGSEDSNGRVAWALGSFIGRTRNEGHQNVAISLFHKAVPELMKMQSPRTWAYSALGASEVLEYLPGDVAAWDLLEKMGSNLAELHRSYSTEDWPWFENKPTYCNGRLCQALMVAGKRCGRPDWTKIGLETMEWLMVEQTLENGMFAPVGTDGFFTESRDIALFDQQPVEAWVTVSACLTTYQLSQDPEWLRRAYDAFEWFLGRNVVGVPMAEISTGACFDGLHATKSNKNQGAESTLSFLCSLVEVRQALPSKLRTVKAKVGLI